jgi:hypothetical protein
MNALKTFFIYLLGGCILGLGYLFLAICFSKSAYATEQPDFKCDTFNVAEDYKCMRENWRPKKQVSYDTGRPYCDRDGQQLHGKGEIKLNVDDEMYSFKIDCP